MINKIRKRINRGLTLIEIMIVLIIIVSLVAFVILILKPQEIFAKMKDLTRLNNIENIQVSVSAAENFNQNLSLGQTQTVYLSLPDSSATCSSWAANLTSLANGWSYHCVGAATLQNASGTGWLPINFTAGFQNLNLLPIDPVNNLTNSLAEFYVYVTNGSGFSFYFKPQSTLYQIKAENDNGFLPEFYEIGTEKITIPFTWANIYNAPVGSISKIRPITNGGSIVVGCGQPQGYVYGDLVCQFWIARLDAEGNVLWQRFYGPYGANAISNTLDMDVRQTSDGGFVVAGPIKQYWWGGWNPGGIIFKLDSQGNLQWSKWYGGTNYFNSGHIIQTSDGGYVMAETWPNIGLFKLDSAGNIQWQKQYGAGSVYSILQTSDGGYLLGTREGNSGTTYVVLFKLDSAGNIQWQKTYSGLYLNPGDYPLEDLRIISLTNDPQGGTYLVAGTGNAGFGQQDVSVLDLDANGNIIWQKGYGGGGSDMNHGVSELVQNNADQGYILSGQTNSFTANYTVGQCYLFEVDTNGNPVWFRRYDTYGSTGNQCGFNSNGYFVPGTNTYVVGTNFGGNYTLIVSVDLSQDGYISSGCQKISLMSVGTNFGNTTTTSMTVSTTSYTASVSTYPVANPSRATLRSVPSSGSTGPTKWCHY